MSHTIVIRPKDIHPDDVLFFFDVAKAMQRLAKKYDLPLRSVSGLPNPNAILGDCSSDGNVRLALRYRSPDGTWGDPRREEDVWGTAAHELAHLKHFNHGPAFQEFEEEMVEALENSRGDHTEKVLRRLVKLQASRESEAAIGNSAAAEAFAGMINKLLIEYELNPSDIDYARTTDRDPVIEVLVDLAGYGIKKTNKRSAWQESLARVVAKAHLCSFLISVGSNRIYFVGTKSHATVAEYAYGVLVPAAAKMADREYARFYREVKDRNPWEARGFRAAWLDAFVNRIGERFAESRKKAVEESVPTGPDGTPINPSDYTMALVRLDGALVKTRAYIDSKFSKKRRYAACLNGGRRYHAEGRARGRAAADTMTLGTRGVTGGKTMKQLASGA